MSVFCFISFLSILLKFIAYFLLLISPMHFYHPISPQKIKYNPTPNNPTPIPTPSPFQPSPNSSTFHSIQFTTPHPILPNNIYKLFCPQPHPNLPPKISLSKFKIRKKQSTSDKSSVYKVQRILDGQIYALKKANILGMNQKQKLNALNQIRILASIRHQNIIGYRQAFLDQNSKSLCIIMEFADNGDLYQQILQKIQKKTVFDQSFIWNVFIQFLRGLKCLHDRKILHRDLKSANIFLTKAGTVKLGDLNVSKITQKGLCHTQTGTPYYASPQVWKDQPYGPKSDIWSLGCVIYQMTTLKPPFQAQDMEGLFKTVIKGQYPKIPSIYSQDLNNLIRIMLQTDPYRRPSCQKILGMKMVLKRIQLSSTQIQYQNPNFLKTIRLPKNIHTLTQNLPQSNYFKPKSKSKSTITTIEPRITYNKTQKLYKKLHEDNNWILLPKLTRKKQLSSHNIITVIKQQDHTIQEQSYHERINNKYKQKDKYRNYIKILKQGNEYKYQNINNDEQNKKKTIDKSMPCIRIPKKPINLDNKMESLQKIYQKSINKRK